MHPEQNQYFADGSSTPGNGTDRKKIVIVVVMVALLAASLFGISRLFNPRGTDTPNDSRVVADRFMDGLIATDASATYALLTPKTKELKSETEWGVDMSEINNLFSSYQYSESLSKTDEASDSETYKIQRYLAKGRDNTYLVSIHVNTRYNRVASFQYNPYVDTGDGQ